MADKPMDRSSHPDLFFSLFTHLSRLLGPKRAFNKPLRHNSSSVRVNPYGGGTEKQYPSRPTMAPSLKR